MNLTTARRLTAVGASAALAASIAIATASPASATTPTWEPTSESVGTITFYDASGNVITSGSTSTAPFAAYAVGSNTVRAGDVQAQVVFANPDPASLPELWFKVAAGNFSAYPLASGPANVQTLSQTHPTVVGTADDAAIDDFESVATQSTQDGYKNVVHIRLKTANASNQATTNYDDADLLIDPTAHTWTQIYPTAAVAPGAPGTPAAVAHDASASVSWSAPADDGGAAITGYELEYSSDGGTTWSTPVHEGTATAATVAGLANGTAYAFRVAADNTAGTGPYSAASATVTPKADASALSVAGPRTTKYGSTITVSGVLADTTAHVGLSGQPVRLYQRASSIKPWALVRTLTSTTGGKVALALRATANGQYQWRYAGSSMHLAATSPTLVVSVSQVVGARANHSSVRHGTAVLVYGTVSPSGSGQRIYLQQLVRTTWKTTRISAVIKKQKLPNGKVAIGFVLKMTLSARGSYHLRVLKPATSTLAAGYSVTITVRAT